MYEQVETVVIGGGQAGLAMSYKLTEQGRQHVVLERGQIGERWRSERWDSLTLLGPNWLLELPGFTYQGDDPDGFLPKDGVVEFLESYAAMFRPPIRCGVEVVSLRQQPDSGRYSVETTNGSILAHNVVIATGPFQKPRIPALSAALPGDIRQFTVTTYRNPAQLPPGGVLIVGSGSSGCQICEELNESGRQVYLSVGRCLRSVRRYRGQDTRWWAYHMGVFERSVDSLPSPAARNRCGTQVTGVRGGHDLDYRQFAANGVVLLGHLRSVEDGTLRFAADLAETMADWDASLATELRSIDDYILSAGIDAPPDDPPSGSPPAGWAYVDPPGELDLAARGISSVVWATGYTPDYGWVELPIFDASGAPIHHRGVTASPGLYFLGLRWQHRLKSSFIYGLDEDATYVTDQIVRRALP
jgi:putative flavoprotein involved in K+ transport